jgi:sugar transferase (PEP-CTERM system associated)
LHPSESVSTESLKLYALSILGFVSFITVERALVLKIFNQSPYLGSILILGTGQATRELIAEARRNHGKTIHLLGILTEDPDEIGTFIEGCKVIGRFDEIQEIVAGCDVKCILISIPIYSTAIPTDFLLKCKLRGILVLDSLEFYESLGKKILLEKLDPVQILLSENLLMSRFRWLLKGSSEKLIAVLLLVLAAPVMLAAALLIRLTSKGPILYKQERIGKDGRPFKLLKFRSMIDGAEKNGPVWAQIDDPRITPVGRILRLFRIDELPQLFNVLRGEMAIVGPRPERPRFVEKLGVEIPFYGNRHLVHPGITGWAQVAYPYGATVEDAREKLRYDLYYIKNMSFFFDLMIVISTIRTVIFARGSR